MRRLPVLPVPFVLFPGAQVPLHVTTQAEREVVARCLGGEGEFGVVYHDPARSGLFTLGTPAVGCAAAILRYQPLTGARAVVLCLGVERFRVVDGVETGAAYPEALVELYEDERGPDDELGHAARRRGSVALYHRVLAEVLRAEPPYPQPDAGREASFQIAAGIPGDPDWAQALLELRDERDRLERVDARMRHLLEAGTRRTVGE
jgi:Lon protease-like protein